MHPARPANRDDPPLPSADDLKRVDDMAAEAKQRAVRKLRAVVDQEIVAKMPDPDRQHPLLTARFLRGVMLDTDDLRAAVTADRQLFEVVAKHLEPGEDGMPWSTFLVGLGDVPGDLSVMTRWGAEADPTTVNRLASWWRKHLDRFRGKDGKAAGRLPTDLPPTSRLSR